MKKNSFLKILVLLLLITGFVLFYVKVVQEKSLRTDDTAPSTPLVVSPTEAAETNSDDNFSSENEDITVNSNIAISVTPSCTPEPTIEPTVEPELSAETNNPEVIGDSSLDNKDTTDTSSPNETKSSEDDKKTKSVSPAPTKEATAADPTKKPQKDSGFSLHSVKPSGKSKDASTGLGGDSEVGTWK